MRQIGRKYCYGKKRGSCPCTDGWVKDLIKGTHFQFDHKRMSRISRRGFGHSSWKEEMTWFKIQWWEVNLSCIWVFEERRRTQNASLLHSLSTCDGLLETKLWRPWEVTPRSADFILRQKFLHPESVDLFQGTHKLLIYFCDWTYFCGKRVIVSVHQISSGLLFSRSIVFDSLWPRGLQPARLLCPWDSPGKNTGVGCHSLLQGIFSTQGSNLHLLHWQTDYIAQNNLEHRDNISLCSKISAQLTKIPLIFGYWPWQTKMWPLVARAVLSDQVTIVTFEWGWGKPLTHSWPIQMQRLCRCGLGNPETGGVGIRILGKVFMI